MKIFKKEMQNRLAKESTCSLQFGLWIVGVFAIVLTVTVVGTVWAVNQALTKGPHLSYAQAQAIISLATLPDLATNVVKEVQARLSDLPRPLLIVRQLHEQPNWVRQFPQPDDPGYLLLAGVDQTAKQSIVQLIRIADGTTVAKWVPDWPVIYKQLTSKKYAPVGSTKAAQAINPLLLPGGDVIFNTGASLVRLSICSQKPVWVLNEVMHHSVELAPNGTLWIPSVSQAGFADNTWLRDRIRDDALANVSTEGKILGMYSFVKILRDNGLSALLVGVTGPYLNPDPIHMNQIRVAPRDSKYWNRGDLLISARHMSAVFLYRPSTGKIIWHQIGPWMNQHAADFVGDHQISVLDNNIIAYAPATFAFLTPAEVNNVMLYDFDTTQTSQPFATLLQKARPVTITGGLARVLPDGGLFIEETNYGRHLRFTRDQLLWSRVNDYNAQYIGTVSWSRYLTAEEAKIPLQSLALRNCSVEVATQSTMAPASSGLASIK